MNYLRVYRTTSSGNSTATETPPAQSTPPSETTVTAPSPINEATPQASPTEASTDVISTRSRASSIFSTGTKTSINTLPAQPPHAESHSGPIDVLLGRRNFRITARPGSILSISSFDHPAPPYSEATGADASQSTATLTGPPVEDDAGPEEPVAEINQPMPHGPRNQLRIITTQPPGPEQDDDEYDAPQGSSRSASPPSPPMSPLSTSTNAISAHYTSVVRTLDANHRAELERLHLEYETAIAQVRNDIDAAYRGPFREARSRADAASAEAAVNKELAEERATEIESLKAKGQATEKELSQLKTSTEKEIQSLRKEVEALKEATVRMKAEADAGVLRARNEVEDVWEGRWRDRIRLTHEQIMGSRQDGQEQGWHEGALHVCRIVESIWAQTEKQEMPAAIREELDRWKSEAEERPQSKSSSKRRPSSSHSKTTRKDDHA